MLFLIKWKEIQIFFLVKIRSAINLEKKNGKNCTHKAEKSYYLCQLDGKHVRFSIKNYNSKVCNSSQRCVQRNEDDLIP